VTGPAVAPKGNLAERDFAHLVHELHHAGWSGNASLVRADFRVSITVKAGNIVFAASTNPDHRLGPLLLRRATVNWRQLTDAGQAVAPGKRLGTILVERGLLNTKELVRAVIDQTQEIVYDAFQWETGTYELKEGTESSESITLSISTPNIILEGMRRIESWSRIERGVGGLLTRFERHPEWVLRTQEMFLGNDQRSLLDDLDEARTVEAICERTNLSDFEACRTLWAFAVIGLVRRPEEPKPEPPKEEEDVDDEGLAYIASGGE
jgi:hypothetical protein